MRVGRLRRLVPVLAVAAVLISAAGCEWPEGTRYVDEVFDEVEVTRDIVYRTTTTYDGEVIELELDIYEPAGDTASRRPAVFWMFAGEESARLIFELVLWPQGYRAEQMHT